ncbi:DUF3048 domain-containing protein [bacterium]|nr:DUF3048 domain-containing protein [bacterium]
MSSPKKEIYLKETKKPKKRKRKWGKVILFLALFILVGLGAGLYYYLKLKPSAESIPSSVAKILPRATKKIPEEKPKFPSLLTGELVEKEKVDLRPFAVVIENHPASRPPAGLSKAGVVFESLTEGGITRFLAFYDELPSKVGPIRSARPYFIDWAEELSAFFLHCGGSEEALKELRESRDLYDVNQFYYGKYFWRERSRVAPHNLYTSGELMEKLVKAKGWLRHYSYSPWVFKDDASLSQRGNVKEVRINFSSSPYLVVYRYNREENVFERYQAGLPHKDEDGSIVKVKNVVLAYYSGYQYRSNSHVLWHFYTDQGGRVKVLRDGKVIEGTWMRNGGRTRFFDESGKEIKLNRGNTWVEVIAPSVSVSIYQSEEET